MLLLILIFGGMITHSKAFCTIFRFDEKSIAKCEKIRKIFIHSF
ncbi:hypothetical protein HMPREF1545_00793 [Oscillibacter sp. KLE 1728]|nr:hypothetical protein HMPREF1545_00793 [Oscillibacter sp. KLE 1728]